MRRTILDAHTHTHPKNEPEESGKERLGGLDDVHEAHSTGWATQHTKWGQHTRNRANSTMTALETTEATAAMIRN